MYRQGDQTVRNLRHLKLLRQVWSTVITQP